MTLLVLALWIAALVLFLVQSASYSLGRVAPGWLGAACATLAVLLEGHVPS